MRTSDLFSGLGGFSAGAERAGCRVVYASDHLQAACEWHAANHPHARHVQQDLQQADMGDIGHPELLLASPSCQGHSTNSQPARRGRGGSHAPDIERAAERTQTQRATSWAVLSAAECSRPRLILVENVPELLGWALLPSWLDGFARLGYTHTAKVLRHQDYGGASERERAFLAFSLDGVRVELADRWGAGQEGRRLEDCVDWDYEGPFWAPIYSKPERTRNLIRTKQAQYGLAEGILNNVGDGVRMRSRRDLAPTLTT